ncbi:MAG: dTDP-4-dehydrorhamnose reductase, partial [Verrucomicrobiales bacterium]|nr:dTDP-4-dehydrorhamnose reductase [Verrucomicrobiales bacterium]
AVLETDDAFLVARESWIFGPDRAGFADSIVERATKSEDCGAIADKWSNPSYSVDMARNLEALVLNPEARGIVNLCNAGSCSWLEYGQAALDFAAEAGVELKCRVLSPQRCADMPGFLAERPVHTAMDTTRLDAWTGQKVRPWQEALADYFGTYYGRR